MTTTPGTELIELETGVFARLHEGLTNAGIIVGDDGVLVIDSLRVPSFARDLIRDVRHITDKPIQYVVDTHSHWDHSWGNEEFPEATIIGHDNCYREMVDVEWNSKWRESVVSSGDPWSEEAGLVTITPPNLTFETSMRLYFGGRELHLKYLGRAHTGGDTHIHLPVRWHRLLRGCRAGWRSPLPGRLLPGGVARHGRPAGRAANRTIRLRTRPGWRAFCPRGGERLYLRPLWQSQGRDQRRQERAGRGLLDSRRSHSPLRRMAELRTPGRDLAGGLRSADLTRDNPLNRAFGDYDNRGM